MFIACVASVEYAMIFAITDNLILMPQYNNVHKPETLRVFNDN